MATWPEALAYCRDVKQGASLAWFESHPVSARVIDDAEDQFSDDDIISEPQFWTAARMDWSGES